MTEDEFADPKECSSWITIYLSKEIEHYLLLERNGKHCGQASGTFPIIPPSSNLVDLTASALEADLILDGEFNDEEIPGVGKLLIQQLNATMPLNSVSASFINEEWVSKIKSWRETTSASPSSLYLLGHHKSL